MKILPRGSKVRVYFWVVNTASSPDVVTTTEHPYTLNPPIFDHTLEHDGFSHWVVVDAFTNMAFDMKDVIEVI